MRLNPDCIRDILLVVEENSGFGKFVRFQDNEDYDALKHYETTTVLYHMKQCELAGLFTETNWSMNKSCLIHDLSPKGHQFLANIREQQNWSAVKTAASKVGSFSLSAIEKIAEGVTTALINGYFEKIMNA